MNDIKASLRILRWVKDDNPDQKYRYVGLWEVVIADPVWWLSIVSNSELLLPIATQSDEQILHFVQDDNSFGGS